MKFEDPSHLEFREKISRLLLEKEFEYIKVVIRIRKSKKDRQNNGQKKND